MQIAASLVPPSLPPDNGDAAPRVVPDVGDAAPPPTTRADGFVELLSQRIAATAAGTDVPTAARGTVDIAGDRATNRVVPAAGDSASRACVDLGTPAAAKSANADDLDDHDRVGDDLAAQLALVAQWAAGASRPTAATGTPASGLPALDAPRQVATAVAAPGAAVRTVAATTAPAAAATGAAARDATPTTATGDADPIVAATDAAVRDAAATIAPAGPDVVVDATGSAVRVAAPAAATSRADATRRDDARAVPVGASAPDRRPATDGVQTSIENLFALAGATGHAVAGDNATVANAFVTQVAAPATNASATQAAAPVAAAPAATVVLHEPVGTAAWSHEVGQATLRMATNDMQTASLHLNPEHLGPVDVRVRVDDGVAHLQFAAVHAETRQALESSRATLDQLFGQQGIKLGDWSVGQQQPRDAGGQTTRGDGGRTHGDTASADVDATTVVATVRTSAAVGLVDTFA